MDAWKPDYPGLEPCKQSNARKASLPTFQCPVNIIFGMRDIALDPRIVLDGIQQYFLPESSESGHSEAMAKERILKLPKCGHWCMLEPDGAAAVEAIVRRAIT